MFTYESIKTFVFQRLKWANPDNARIMEAQALGCVQFVCDQCWQTQPELEAQLIKAWNDEWHNLFARIYL